jgi:glycosyltransferase involved in cell wall biosynthesis
MRLLYVVTEDWYFLSHRLPMARAARDAGFEVHVATRVVDGGDAIRAEGFTLHPVPFTRGRVSPVATLRTIIALRRLYRKVSPGIVHHVAVQAAVLGSLAALGTHIKLVNAMTGLGFVFTSASTLASLMRPLATAVLRFVCNRRNSLALVQNGDDKDALLSIGIAPERIALIPGSGVDVQTLQPQPEPSGPITVAFVGRLLDDKGIRTLIAAHRQLRTDGAKVELLIAGTPDPANPASVTQQEASSWNKEPGITWLGHWKGMAALWARAHIAALPSRREGMPKTLLEAAACQKPMIATDVPGCREIVVPDETGILVPADDAPALAAAIAKLAASPELRARYGLAARKRVVEMFSNEIIGRMTVELYHRLLTPRAGWR